MNVYNLYIKSHLVGVSDYEETVEAKNLDEAVEIFYNKLGKYDYTRDFIKENIEDETSEMIAQKKLEWLKERSSSFKDVLSDEEGEFILDEEDTGHPSDDGYAVNIRKIYLPDFTQEL